MSPEISDLDRQDSIVRSSWLSGADRTAAQVARRRASTRVSRSQDSEETAIEGMYCIIIIIGLFSYGGKFRIFRM